VRQTTRRSKCVSDSAHCKPERFFCPRPNSGKFPGCAEGSSVEGAHVDFGPTPRRHHWWVRCDRCSARRHQRSLRVALRTSLRWFARKLGLSLDLVEVDSSNGTNRNRPPGHHHSRWSGQTDAIRTSEGRNVISVTGAPKRSSRRANKINGLLGLMIEEIFYHQSVVDRRILC
jgi:hypothetical protein